MPRFSAMLSATNSLRFLGSSIRSTARPQPKSIAVERISSERNLQSQQA
jgi:hypothetical protein